MPTVYIAPIREENMATAEALNAELSRALMTADISRCDCIVSELQALAEQSESLQLSHSEWEQILADLRQTTPDFQANCVLKQAEMQVFVETGQARGNTQLKEMVTYPGCLMLPRPGEETDEE